MGPVLAWARKCLLTSRRVAAAVSCVALAVAACLEDEMASDSPLSVNCNSWPRLHEIPPPTTIQARLALAG